MFGTSDTWLMSCLSHQPSEPAYHTEDCQILHAKNNKDGKQPKMTLLTKFIKDSVDSFLVWTEI